MLLFFHTALSLRLGSTNTTSLRCRAKDMVRTDQSLGLGMDTSTIDTTDTFDT